KERIQHRVVQTMTLKGRLVWAYAKLGEIQLWVQQVGSDGATRVHDRARDVVLLLNERAERQGLPAVFTGEPPRLQRGKCDELDSRPGSPPVEGLQRRLDLCGDVDAASELEEVLNRLMLAGPDGLPLQLVGLVVRPVLATQVAPPEPAGREDAVTLVQLRMGVEELREGRDDATVRKPVDVGYAAVLHQEFDRSHERLRHARKERRHLVPRDRIGQLR